MLMDILNRKEKHQLRYACFTMV